MRSSPGSLVAISGPVCAGKSTLAAGLAGGIGARILTTRLLIADHLKRAPDELTRGELQRAGEELDRQRGGAWVAEQIAGFARGDAPVVVIDAARNAQQLAALRIEARTLHVHLTADSEVLARRYTERSLATPQLEFPEFEELRINPTEAQVETLADLADLAIDTSHTDIEDTLRKVTNVFGQCGELPD